MGDTTEEMGADEDPFAALRLYPVGCHREERFGLRAGAPPFFFFILGFVRVIDLCLSSVRTNVVASSRVALSSGS